MSFLFGGGGGGGGNNNGASNPPLQATSNANLAAAEQELEMVTDLFNRIVDVCHAKCIPPKYHEAELTRGESMCIDRCVNKFFSVNKAIGEKLQTMGGGGVR